MKRLSRKFGKALSLAFILVSLLAFSLTLDFTQEKIGKPFPGYLAFKNQVVGAFYVPGWSGPQEGRTYHARPAEVKNGGEIFSRKDYLWVVLLPAISGILFVVLGAALCSYLPSEAGRLPLLLFHFLAGNYLILSPEFHLTYSLSYPFLGLFVLIPAPMIHFALLFPERASFSQRHRWLYFAPYACSALLFFPYAYFFMRDPRAWIVVEYGVVFYVIFAYLFWWFRLFLTLRRPQAEPNRVIARYLFLGQIIAFAIPLGGAAAIFIGRVPFPLNFAAPLTLLFPIALFIGVLLGRFRQGQMQLVQSEKSAALGSLLSGLAHEINNPMTFIYSAIEPLRDSLRLAHAKTSLEEARVALRETESLIDAMEEGATRTLAIIENFRYFSDARREQREAVDLHKVIEYSLLLLSPKWKGSIQIVRKFGDLPRVECFQTEIGQVFVNVLSNACDAVRERGRAGGRIEVTTELSPAQVKVAIRDTGSGMAPEVLSRIFDSFYTTKEPGKGTGLGLAISLEIVKKHRGTIEVKSEPGKGTEFLIALPVA